LSNFRLILLDTAFFCETVSLDRMFFQEYLDPQAARWEQVFYFSGHSNRKLSFSPLDL